MTITERDLQDAAVELLLMHDWLVYHTFDSRRSQPGFPDLIAVKGPRLLAIECKSDKGRPTPEQIEWLTAFTEVREVDAFILRPGPDMSELEALL